MINRRSIIQAAGTGIGAASLARLTSGIAAADDSPSQITVENGRFVLDGEPNQIEEYEFWKAAIEDFNEAIEAGHMSIVENHIEINSSPSEMVGGEQ